ncbi:MAG TPA: cytochrome c biogenesis protein CcsA [Edaphobacter sp.]|jgi:heme exporter protein C|nr:cytochrome c biogenesis protein CcsA [Edaphobacter sp.]
MAIVSRSAIIRSAAWLWFIAALAILAIGFREAIFIAPTEATMGNVQRIFYYHVPSAIMGLIFPYVNFIASLAYLYWRRRDPLKALSADALALASAEVTIVFVSIGLMTGMLWGRASWGIWWAWDARLTTYLLLWLLYVSYLLLRRFSSTGEAHTLAAVISVFAAVDVPIVYMSIHWWRTQHPSPVFSDGGSIDPNMMTAFLWNVAGWGLWGVFIMLFRFALERRRQLAEQDNALIAIEASLETAP